MDSGVEEVPPFGSIVLAGAMPFIFGRPAGLKAIRSRKEFTVHRGRGSNSDAGASKIDADASKIENVRARLNKAQNPREQVTIVTTSLKIDSFHLYNKNGHLSEERNVVCLNIAFSLFRESALSGEGIGSVVFWIEDSDRIGAEDALQYIETFRNIALRNPPAAVVCKGFKSEPFEGVSEIAQRALARFFSAYPKLRAKQGSSQTVWFTHPFLYIGTIRGTQDAASIQHKYGRELTALSRVYRLWTATVKQSEVQDCFQGDLLQYEYGVILSSASVTIEGHCEYGVPDSLESDIVEDIFQLVLMVERPMIRHFIMMQFDDQLKSDLDKAEQRSRGIFSISLASSWLIIAIASIIILAFVKSGYRPNTHWVERMVRSVNLLLSKHGVSFPPSVDTQFIALLSSSFVAALSIHIVTQLRHVVSNWTRRRDLAQLVYRYKSAPIMGEPALGRIDNAYVKAFSTERLSQSVDDRQAALDAILESSFRVFLGVIGPLIALFIALVR